MTVPMNQREEWNRAKWASRRGLLELDLLLAPFVNDAFNTLDDGLRSDYRELLFQDDHSRSHHRGDQVLSYQQMQ